MKPYIYHQPNWPYFEWDSASLEEMIGRVRNLQGKVLGKMEHLGFELMGNASLETISTDVITSSEIEGELLDRQQVRSSVARRLGIEISGLVPSDQEIDGVVEMTLDATQNFSAPLTKERLFGWHNCLFPTGRSGMYKILVAQWRDDSTGPMQVVSGAMGKEKVHFEAPSAETIETEMQAFLKWFNAEQKIDLVVKAAIAHLWFLTIHPFEDGNGRIARALTDMILARSDNMKYRLYSLSAQIKTDKKSYYHLLEKTQKGTLDITNWLIWFFECFEKALFASEEIVKKVVFKYKFWIQHAQDLLNERQVKMLNRLMDSFDGKLTSSKWAKMTKCSTDTALRDIQALLEKGILTKSDEGGRSTNYDLVRD